MLSLATLRLRKQLVEKGGKDIVDCLSECCVDVLKGNVPLASKQNSLLAKHKKKLRIVVRKMETIVKKKIIQTGGFLGALLNPEVAFLGNLLLP